MVVGSVAFVVFVCVATAPWDTGYAHNACHDGACQGIWQDGGTGQVDATDEGAAENLACRPSLSPSHLSRETVLHAGLRHRVRGCQPLMEPSRHLARVQQATICNVVRVQRWSSWQCQPPMPARAVTAQSDQSRLDHQLESPNPDRAAAARPARVSRWMAPQIAMLDHYSRSSRLVPPLLPLSHPPSQSRRAPPLPLLLRIGLRSRLQRVVLQLRPTRSPPNARRRLQRNANEKNAGLPLKQRRRRLR